MESLEESLGDRSGTFNHVHSAATTGADRVREFFSIVEGSGTGALASLRDSRGMQVDADGRHRVWFDVEALG